MAEIRTLPVTAAFQGEVAFGTSPRDLSWPAGGFGIEPTDIEGGEPEREQRLWWACPCGCGHITFLHVGNGFKPAGGPSWHWNGSTNAPSQPCQCPMRCTEGDRVRNGVWESC